MKTEMSSPHHHTAFLRNTALEGESIKSMGTCKERMGSEYCEIPSPWAQDIVRSHHKYKVMEIFPMVAKLDI